MENVNGNMSLCEIVKLAEDEIRKLEYSSNWLAQYKRAWERFVVFSAERGVTEFSESVGSDFLKAVYGWPSESRNTSYMRTAARAVRVLGDLQKHGVILRKKRILWREWEDHFKETMERFKSYANKVLSDSSTYRIEQVLFCFFDFLLGQGIKDCRHISKQHIEGFAATLSGYAKKTLALNMYGLRVFLKFLHEDGIIECDIRDSVPTIRYVNRRNVPATWSKEETNKIIGAVDRCNPCGKRDYAILLTIARLGLRQSDVVGLMFEHIDWQKCTISITQAKTKRHLMLPLPEDVGTAIIDYLKNGRPPCDEPYVFLKHTPPFEKMCAVYTILDKHVRLAKISRPKGGFKGAHTLRHSLAGRMLENGTSIETISAVLGHASLTSTLDYLKIDIDALSECSIDPEEVIAYA